MTQKPVIESKTLREMSTGDKVQTKSEAIFLIENITTDYEKSIGKGFNSKHPKTIKAISVKTGKTKQWTETEKKNIYDIFKRVLPEELELPKEAKAKAREFYTKLYKKEYQKEGASPQFTQRDIEGFINSQIKDLQNIREAILTGKMVIQCINDAGTKFRAYYLKNNELHVAGCHEMHSNYSKTKRCFSLDGYGYNKSLEVYEGYRYMVGVRYSSQKYRELF